MSISAKTMGCCLKYIVFPLKPERDDRWKGCNNCTGTGKYHAVVNNINHVRNNKRMVYSLGSETFVSICIDLNAKRMRNGVKKKT